VLLSVAATGDRTHCTRFEKNVNTFHASDEKRSCFKKEKTKTHTPDFIKKGREPRILPIARPSAYQREEAVLGASRPTGLPSGRMRGHDDGESRGGGQTVRV